MRPYLFLIKITLLSIFIFPATSHAGVDHKISISLQKRIEANQRSAEMIAVLVKGDLEKIKVNIQALGGIYKYGYGRIASVKIPLSNVKELALEKSTSYIDDVRGRVVSLHDMALPN